MKNKTGYKQMLRDRVPKVVNFALRWCKAKEAWLNHVYSNWIWIYKSNEERLKVTKTLLGLDKKPREFKFADTILWDNLSKDEEKRWKSIVSWVSWFQKEYQFVENEYSNSKKLGHDIMDIKRSIMLNHLYEWCPTAKDDAKTKKKKNKKLNEFVDFLIDCFEDRI